MSARVWSWLVAALLYAAFWAWYTPLGGPLTPAEIDDFVGRLEARGGDPARVEELRQFMVEDDGRAFVMVNLLDMATEPPTLPATGPGAPAEALLDHYMAHMFPALFARACHPVFVGDAVFSALEVTGIDGAKTWTRAGLVRYRSRRDMMAIATDPAFYERHDYKLAALAKTIAFPAAPVLNPGDLRAVVALLLLVVLLLADRVLGRRRH